MKALKLRRGYAGCIPQGPRPRVRDSRIPGSEGRTKGFLQSLIVFGLCAYFLVGISLDLQASQDASPEILSGINTVWLEKMKETMLWGRNPFRFPRSGEPTVQADGLQLTAIFYHTGGGLAIINNRIVRPGDLLGDRKVVSIMQDRVIIRDLTGLYELKIEPFTVQQ